MEVEANKKIYSTRSSTISGFAFEEIHSVLASLPIQVYKFTSLPYLALVLSQPNVYLLVGLLLVVSN